MKYHCRPPCLHPKEVVAHGCAVRMIHDAHDDQVPSMRAETAQKSVFIIIFAASASEKPKLGAQYHVVFTQ